MFLVKDTNNTKGTVTKAELFKELERLDLERESLHDNTNLSSRISFTEIADASCSTPIEEFIKEIEKVSLLYQKSS